MSDIAAFLRECFDEDERIARDAYGISRDALFDLYEDLIKSRPLDGQRRLFGIFIGRFTPGRMLDDVAAKRRVLEAYRRMVEDFEHVTETASEHARRTALEDVLEMLALPYASHHEYRKEWRP